MKTSSRNLLGLPGATLVVLAASLMLAQSADGDRPPTPPPAPPPPPEGGPAVRAERDAPGPDRRANPEMEERLRRMDAEIKELRRVGDHAAADRLERQRNQVRERPPGDREPREMLAPMVPGDAGPRPPMDAERRQQMVRMAIENLRAAGLPELAERVARDARDLMDRAGGERMGGRPMGGRDGAVGAGDRTERLEMTVMELQRALREMERRLRVLER